MKLLILLLLTISFSSVAEESELFKQTLKPIFREKISKDYKVFIGEA